MELIDSRLLSAFNGKGQGCRRVIVVHRPMPMNVPEISENPGDIIQPTVRNLAFRN
jgi:hypothetical protein